MKKRKWFAEVTITVLLLLVILAAYLYLNAPAGQAGKVDVSVVVRGSDTERWIAFEQGARQAASDLGGILNFVTMSEGDDWQDQLAAMHRERENGAKGIVVVPDESYRMEEGVRALSEEITLVCAESALKSKRDIECVCADGYEMGRALAMQLMRKEYASGQVTLILEPDTRLIQKERMEGFAEAIEHAGWTLHTLSSDEEEGIAAALKGGGPVAALDAGILEEISDAAALADNKKVYGIGSTPKVVRALDMGTIRGIVFQNEYIMGYEALSCLLNRMGHVKTSYTSRVDHHEATDETLHLPENERLLYPLTQ